MTAREDGLSISLELVDTRDDSHVWGSSYDVRTADLASLHEQVARDLHRRLRRHLTSEGAERVARLHTDDSAAYQLYLQGRFYWHRPLPEDYHRSRDYFQRAIELDPDYALAWSGLGHYFGRGATVGFLKPDEYWPRAEQAAQRTIELDPDLPEARSLLAAIALYWHRDWLEGERLMRQAFEVFPEAANHLSLLLNLTGRLDESLRLSRRDLADDPDPVRSNRVLATGYYFARRYQEAIEQTRVALELDETDVPSWELLGDVWLELGRDEEALAAWRQGLLLEGRPELAEMLERTYGESGLEAAMGAVANARLEALRARVARGDHVPAYTFARQLLRAGERSAALDSAEQAFAERNRFPLDMLSDPVFDPLRDELRFRDGARRLGLPAEWTDAISRSIGN
jgi:tetratricopeptide (TPR) repeat protein